VIDPAGIPQITGDMEALSAHAAAVTRVAADFADTGGRVDGTWQELAGVYRAPEAAQLLAATAPVRTVSASVGEDLGAVGTALATYATTVAEIKTRLEALRADALAFVGSVAGDDGWRSDEGRVDEHNRLVSDVGAAVADFTDAQRTCANSILALHSGRRWVADDGDGVLGPDEFGYSAEALDAAVAEDGALPWGSAEEHDRDFLGDVGAFFGGVGQGAVDMVTGLGALIGYADGGWSWSTAGTAWAGLGTFAGALVVYSTPGGIALDQTTGVFGQERGFLGNTLLNAGKTIIAYDTWGEDPQRAAGMTTFNVVSAVLGTKGAGAGLRGAGAAAQGSRFATVVRLGTGATRAGEFLGRLPTTRSVIASLADRFPRLHVPHVDVPGGDAPTAHVDAPRVDLPAPVHLGGHDGPSIGDAVGAGDAVRAGDGAPDALDAPGVPNAPDGALLDLDAPDTDAPDLDTSTTDTPAGGTATLDTPGADTPGTDTDRAGTDAPTDPAGAADPSGGARELGTRPDGSWVGEEHGARLELSPEANAAADDLLRRAADAETVITPDVRAVVGGVDGARLQGYDFVLKGEDSLKRKIATDLDRFPGRAPEQAVSAVRDSVRYTMEIPPGSYAEGIERAVADLRARGYENVAFKPTWGDPGAYKGVNTTWLDPRTGQVFELQFHTPDSFVAKMETHGLYEAMRVPGVPPAEVARLAAAQAEMFRRVEVPAGVGRLLALGDTLAQHRTAPAAAPVAVLEPPGSSSSPASSRAGPGGGTGLDRPDVDPGDRTAPEPTGAGAGSGTGSGPTGTGPRGDADPIRTGAAPDDGPGPGPGDGRGPGRDGGSGPAPIGGDEPPARGPGGGPPPDSGAGPGGDPPEDPRLVRKDDDFSAEYNDRRTRKSHLDAEGNLVPANPHGTTTIVEHIVGRGRDVKGNSPFTSFSAEGALAKEFGGRRIVVDLPRLRSDVESGRLSGVEVLPPERVQAELQADADRIAGRPVDLRVRSIAEIDDRAAALGLDAAGTRQVRQRMIDMFNTRRDEEWLIKGVVPSRYIDGPFDR
jgi:hypothetical protein